MCSQSADGAPIPEKEATENIVYEIVASSIRFYNKEEAEQSNPFIQFEDFLKVQLKVGQIVEADKHPNADRLLALKVEVGEDRPRSIVAGIAAKYDPSDLVGKNIVIVANLKPRKLRGVLSEGMLLAAILVVSSTLFWDFGCFPSKNH